MSTEIAATGLPTNRPVCVPEFSITPLHAHALSNIYANISKDLFISKSPKPMRPRSIRSENYHSRWQNPTSIAMASKPSTTSPHNLLATKKLEASCLSEMPFQHPLTFPRLQIKKTTYTDGPVYPQYGDFRIDKLIKYEKTGVPASSSSIGAHTPRKPIKGGGLVSEILHILPSPHITKEQFPQPFCELPDEQFVAWCVRNMKMVGWEEWAAETEALGVLRRTEEVRVSGEWTVVDVGERVEREESGCGLVAEMRARLERIERRRKMERREGRIRRARERKKRVEQLRDETDSESMEDESVKKEEWPVKHGKMTWLKKLFWWR
jgi:hypothetical protein